MLKEILCTEFVSKFDKLYLLNLNGNNFSLYYLNFLPYA
jgi:hypothetical protein